MNEHTPKHIVAVGGLVMEPATGHILLIRSPRRGWEFPGGQVEEGENLIEATVREVREETGLEITVRSLAGVYSNTRTNAVMFGFLCDWTGAGMLATSSESLEVEWVARDTALDRVSRPWLRDRLRDMLEFQGSVVYRAYSFDSPEGDAPEYIVYEQRHL